MNVEVNASLKERELFPFKSHKCVPDGLVGWLVGEGIASLKERGISLFISLSSFQIPVLGVPDGLVCWLVGKFFESLMKSGLFPFISPEWVPDGLVGWLVGE